MTIYDRDRRYLQGQTVSGLTGTLRLQHLGSAGNTKSAASTPRGQPSRLPVGCIKLGTGRQASAQPSASWTVLVTLGLIRLSHPSILESALPGVQPWH